MKDQKALNGSLGRISKKGKERLSWEFDRYKPYALSVYNGKNPGGNSVTRPVRMPKDRLKKGSLDESRILTGGDPFAKGDPVTPGVLTILATKSTEEIPEEIEGRRLPFADWVASEENPLTTRSIVNRVWLWHFGDAIAGNPNNFGGTGKRPTHPQILDFLAAELVESGWSIKHIHRLIMTSETYRRSSTHPNPDTLTEKDPALESYAVFKPRRLSAEELRDTMLAATGELNPDSRRHSEPPRNQSRSRPPAAPGHGHLRLRVGSEPAPGATPPPLHLRAETARTGQSVHGNIQLAFPGLLL